MGRNRSTGRKYDLLIILQCTFICLIILISVASYSHVAFAGSSSVQEPNWPLKVISWDLNRAYPGVYYEYRLGIQGGQYPYTCKLLSGPAGMNVDKISGTITWDPSTDLSKHDIRVEILDRKGKRIVHSFPLHVSEDSFRFVAANGNDNNPGTEALPWATVKHAVKTATNSRYIYIKEGNYPVEFDIGGDDCGKLLAFPGHQVTLTRQGSYDAVIGLTGKGEYIFQGFHFNANSARWFFSADSQRLSNMIVRKNKFSNIDDNSWENPSFLFFWDGPQKPILGQVHYQNILVQENTFHDLRNPNDHGASAILYDVQDLVYEDNIAYDIDGNGVLDKDDGYRNTFRNNFFHHCARGIVLSNQHTQGQIDVHHNLIHNCREAFAVGWQPGFLRDVFIHHNTIVGSVIFGRVLHNNPKCYNLNLYRNIIGQGKDYPYQFVPVENGEQYDYPSYVLNPSDETVRADHNLIWASNADKIAGYEWGLPDMSISDWRGALYDQNSLLDNPMLNRNFSLAKNSPYYGVYGRDNARIPVPGTKPVRPPSPPPTTTPTQTSTPTPTTTPQLTTVSKTTKKPTTAPPITSVSTSTQKPTTIPTPISVSTSISRTTTGQKLTTVATLTPRPTTAPKLNTVSIPTPIPKTITTRTTVSMSTPTSNTVLTTTSESTSLPTSSTATTPTSVSMLNLTPTTTPEPTSFSTSTLIPNVSDGHNLVWVLGLTVGAVVLFGIVAFALKRRQRNKDN